MRKKTMRIEHTLDDFTENASSIMNSSSSGHYGYVKERIDVFLSVPLDS